MTDFGRVFDGTSFIPITPQPPTAPDETHPVHAYTSTDSAKSSIFVSIPHFRDGNRCASTLKHLFESASHPERVYVGLIEQTSDDDPTCLLGYCALMGYKMKEHEAGFIHKGEKQADYDRVMAECPRIHQIRSVNFHHLGAKGPVYARSFIRKVLANEGVHYFVPFCLYIEVFFDIFNVRTHYVSLSFILPISMQSFVWKSTRQSNLPKVGIHWHCSNGL